MTGLQEEGASGVEPTFRAVFEAEFTYVSRSLQRCGVRDADVEDLVHDVFLAAHVRFASFDRARPVKPWLFGIAFRIASHYRRRAGYRREEAMDLPEAPDPAPAADVMLESHQKRALLAAALDTLDDDRRAVLIMHDLDGLPMSDIARELGVPVFTAYSRLRLGREQLASHVRRQLLKRGGDA